jgi:hypothetical protein
MTSPNQPHRIFGFTGKELALVGVIVMLACLGIGAAAFAVSHLAATMTTTLNQPADTPEATRRPRTATPLPTPTATSLPTNTATPTPTATPRLGESRSRPLPSEAVVRSGDWQAQVLDFKRGVEAAQLIREANQFNRPVPEGKEYVLLKVRVKSLHTAGQAHGLLGGNFSLTGERLLHYLPAGVVPPQPRLAIQLSPGDETEGWIVYAIDAGEDRLIAEFEQLGSNASPVFIALQPGTTINIDPALADLAPSAAGRTHEEAARLGDTLIADDWQITVLEALYGDRAFQMVQAASRHNDPPAVGMEYLAVRTRVKNLDLRDRITLLNNRFFKTLGDRNVLYAAPPVAVPEPKLEGFLYPGGEVEGWVILQIGQGEGDVQVVFEPWYDTQHVNRRYIALPQ